MMLHDYILPFILLLWAHVIGDFLIQVPYHLTHQVSFNSRLDHVAVYSIPFIFISIIIPLSGLWLIINLILHDFIDKFSNKFMDENWKKDNFKNFYLIMVSDQAIHLFCLMITYYFFHHVNLFFLLNSFMTI